MVGGRQSANLPVGRQPVEVPGLLDIRILSDLARLRSDTDRRTAVSCPRAAQVQALGLALPSSKRIGAGAAHRHTYSGAACWSLPLLLLLLLLLPLLNMTCKFSCLQFVSHFQPWSHLSFARLPRRLACSGKQKVHFDACLLAGRPAGRPLDKGRQTGERACAIPQPETWSTGSEAARISGGGGGSNRARESLNPTAKLRLAAARRRDPGAPRKTVATNLRMTSKCAECGETRDRRGEPSLVERIKR